MLIVFILILGQVVSVLKELKELTSGEIMQCGRHLTTHISIPASYQSGVTIFLRSDNPCRAELFETAQLPLLDE